MFNGAIRPRREISLGGASKATKQIDIQARKARSKAVEIIRAAMRRYQTYIHQPQLIRWRIRKNKTEIVNKLLHDLQQVSEECQRAEWLVVAAWMVRSISDPSSTGQIARTGAKELHFLLLLLQHKTSHTGMLRASIQAESGTYAIIRDQLLQQSDLFDVAMQISLELDHHNQFYTKHILSLPNEILSMMMEKTSVATWIPNTVSRPVEYLATLDNVRYDGQQTRIHPSLSLFVNLQTYCEKDFAVYTIMSDCLSDCPSGIFVVEPRNFDAELDLDDIATNEYMVTAEAVKALNICVDSFPAIYSDHRHHRLAYLLSKRTERNVYYSVFSQAKRLVTESMVENPYQLMTDAACLNLNLLVK